VNGNENNAGGVITMWRKSCFHLSTVSNGSNYSIIEGEWRLEDPIQTVVVNIYNTGSVLEKKAIWEEVRVKRLMINTKVWCVGILIPSGAQARGGMWVVTSITKAR